MCDNLSSPVLKAASATVFNLPDAGGVMLTPNSSPQTEAGYCNSPKRKEREDSTELEVNKKKLRTNAFDDEDRKSGDPSGDGNEESGPAAVLDREIKEKAEDKPAGPSNTPDEGNSPILAEAPKRPITPPPMVTPSVFVPRSGESSTEDAEFEGCVVHPGKRSSK
jgi:hypothetical protein